MVETWAILISKYKQIIKCMGVHLNEVPFTWELIKMTSYYVGKAKLKCISYSNTKDIASCYRNPLHSHIRVVLNSWVILQNAILCISEVSCHVLLKIRRWEFILLKFRDFRTVALNPHFTGIFSLYCVYNSTIFTILYFHYVVQAQRLN